jgi:NAD(P)-dependent dehydrogenase (short-subunit alcohol dehydrogenase family)
MPKLDGKVALVTGGTSGIGLAAAKALAAEGAHIYITGRRERELVAAVEEIGRNASGVRGDVSNVDDLERLYAQIRDEKGRLDILFANAGIAKYAALGKITEELYDSIFNVNVKGVLFTVPESTSADARRCIDHSKCVSGRQQRPVLEQCLQRHEGGHPLVRANMDYGSQRSPNPGKRDQSRHY